MWLVLFLLCNELVSTRWWRFWTFKSHAPRCDILQETGCFYRTVCKSVCVCMCDEALFALCLPGSWTTVPEVKLAVVSLSLRSMQLLCPPALQTQQKGKMAANLSLFPASLLCLCFALRCLRNVLINLRAENAFLPQSVLSLFTRN